jgi:hypothetical protein
VNVAVMGGLRRNDLTRGLLFALYVLAAATFGFAHKPITPASNVDLAAYALPDGSLPFVCGGGKGVPGGKHACSACAACLLSAAPGLINEHDRLLSVAQRFVVDAWPDGYRANVGTDWPPNFRSRAPPYPDV